MADDTKHRPTCAILCVYWPKPFDACLEHPNGHACDCGAQSATPEPIRVVPVHTESCASRRPVVTVSEFAGFPVTVDITWALINGRRVCFYSDASRVVDHDMIKAWRHEVMPEITGRHCNCLDHVWPRDTRSPEVLAAIETQYKAHL